MLPAGYQVPAAQFGWLQLPVGGGVVPPPQAPWSAHTSAVPGVSFWVHHFADQLRPLWEAVMPLV
ncbi:hypothetical protein GCM10018952_62600 [Streptosporangium vulgare]